MKRTLIILLTALTITLPLYGQNEDLYCKHRHDLLANEQRAAAARLEFRSEAPTGNYDLKYHRLEWKVTPTKRYIEGDVTSYFVTKQPDFRSIVFELDQALTVTGVTYRGQAVDFEHTPDHLVTISLPVSLPAGQLDSVTVSYQGAPPETGFGSFVQDTHNGIPVLWTLSEPYGARDWWPCKQDLNDKIDSIDVFIQTQDAYQVASNGLLVSERTEGSSTYYHWRHRYPIPAYLIAIAITRYSIYSDFVPVDGGEPIEVLNYVYPESLESARQQTPRIIPIMRLFNELFGLYPFAAEKYGHAQFGFGGGMEHQTMSFMYNFSHLLQAHELAHQWFGNKVTCGSWEDIWLNEGFATYLEGLTYEYGVGNYPWANWLQNRINYITSQPGGSVWVDDTTSVGRIFSGRLSYDKGAMLLHMLRWKLGDEAFFRGVRNYIDDPKLAFGYARTADLQQHLETAGGQDLDEFFADWLYGEGYPSYYIRWNQQDGRVSLEVYQQTSHPSVDFFEMPIPIRMVGKEGDSTVVFDHSFSGQAFSVEMPFAVDTLLFDPDHWIISRNNRTVGDLVTATTGLPELDRSLRIWPNPAREVLNIDYSDWPSPPRALELWDWQGRLLRRFSGNEPITLSSLPAGPYLLRLIFPEGTLRRSFIKE